MISRDRVFQGACIILAGKPTLLPEDAVRFALQVNAALDRLHPIASALERLPDFCSRCGHDFVSAGWSQCPQCEPAF